MMHSIRKCWRWLKANWKAAIGGLSVLLVLFYTALSNRNRGKAIDARRKAHQAGQDKAKAVTEAKHHQAKAEAHGQQAEAHQAKARAVVEKLRTREKTKPRLADARELAERINNRGKQ